MKPLRWCRRNWFRLFRWFNGGLMWSAIVAFIAWWWVPWAIYITIGGFCWIALIVAAIAIPHNLSVRHEYNLPRWLEVPAFESFRWHLEEFNRGMPPLMAYPFALFRELELPPVFWERGLLEAVKLAAEWPDEFKGRFDNFTDELLAMKGDEEAQKKVAERHAREKAELIDKAEARARELLAAREKLDGNGG